MAAGAAAGNDWISMVSFLASQKCILMIYESILQGARMLEDEQTMVSHTLEAKVDFGGIDNII